MRVELLGPLRVLGEDGTEVPVPAGRQRALLARLALEGGAVTAAALIGAVWPEDPPANAGGALHTQLSRLRGLLGDRLESGPGGYRLAADTDIDAFERFAAGTEAASREDRPAAARDSAEAALALWRGTALADLDGYAFAETARTRLAMRRDTVAALHLDARLRLEGADAVLAELAARHGADVLNEPDAARYMRALAAAGRRAEALAVFGAVRERLADELGVDPSAVLREAHLDVLREAPPQAARPKQHRLPEPLTACIGRESEIAAVTGLLEANRLVTLTGPGGTGKTRLAVETANRLVAEGREVRLVELAPVADPSRLPEVFGDAIGLGESILARRSEDPRTRLTDALWGRDLLLAVDNCEHLIEDAAELLAHLLGRVPGLRVLATSREALGITGEAVLGVGPLPLPERAGSVADLRSHAAIALFEERARQSDPGFAVDAANADAVLQVCAALDGLPLAIELAAARLRAMSIEDLSARLDDRFGLLGRGPRTAEPRQRTLRAVVDWSWDLLDPRERLVLARMSVFSGSADLAAACAVCSASADDITGLVEKSLVQRLPGGRYRLLETVREYAAARLAEAGETAERFERHAEHYAALAEEAEPHLMRAEQVEWLDRLGAEHANLFAAIRRMVAAGNARVAYRAIAPLSWYWWMRGFREEGMELARQVRAIPLGSADSADSVDADDADPLHRAKVSMAGSWGLWSGRIDPVEIDAEFAAAQRISEEHGLFAVEPLLQMIPMIRAMIAGDGGRMREILDRLTTEEHAWVRGIGLLFVSEFSYRSGRPDAAAAELAESNAIFASMGDRFGLILSWQGLAADRMAAGDYPGARELLVRAIAAEAEFGADLSDSVIADQLWRIDAEHGDDPETMLERMRAQQERAERIGNAENALAARNAAAICLRRMGKGDEALRELLDAEQDLPRFQSFSEVTMQLYRQLASIAREQGDPDLEARAASMLEQSTWPFSS
ncbi:BTAD domain-containing putative transcriptional regulator [Glycomyces algeriensis]|uniref:SARP family transcriptional regulator n=1 Tax=Glycomyces algeriensis TaxID=256037 RepID=A0A9W6GCH0_9ACTN|nr:BTAD domain-containing putative transcriptional regulator [Glycomyces algeriensis]MDA1366740.1 BTAD domain-containing putative transcriptional regulator [Glycomyces algeriensis]MDR7351627.1 putative ATPase/DNA-binding SARP family transcriptional activator [Glycomyces algeriensis]GLI44350.1 SARP family transcriptional regulator [Glycomyces algeriensis]